MWFTRNPAVLACLISTIAISAYGQYTKSDGNKECTAQLTCAQCIKTPNCEWCSEIREASDKNALKPRCVHESLTGTKKGSSWCPKNMILRRDPVVEILNNTSFSSDKDNPVQIMPQRVKMVLHLGQEERLKIKYKQAEDYPVDLYFLMDLSASMETHKDNLAKLGYKLAAAMEDLTSNFHLGFGSFVDKVILPMTNTQPEWSSELCVLKNHKKCAPPYGYKNQMKLTHKIEEFQRNVETAPISGNLDAPEGGLDALMQTIVCWDRIGWRNNSRHIIVYSSDAAYHIAGDGKLAGLIEPNDEQCHLDDKGFYTEAEKLDYPSISQIRKQALEKSINIIFAVTSDKDVQAQYKDLSLHINGSSVATLDDKSDSVVSLVRQQYEDLTNSITMNDNAGGPLELKYFTRCLTKQGPLQERNKCGGVRVDTPIEFEVAIRAIECPKKLEDRHRTIEIKPEGVNEKVIIDVDIICDCPCSRPGHKDYEPNSEMCTKNGDLSCGVCACKDGYHGSTCNCKGENDEPQGPESDAPCRDLKGEICGGHGDCVCGICQCDPRLNIEEKFYGQFCECDNFSCERLDNLVCGGPSRGRCDCGTCICQPGLNGTACGCRTSNSTCIPPGENATLCSGFGECICGECKCSTPERNGAFCEKCPTCPSQRCDGLKDCVECRVHKSGPKYTEDEKCESCGNIDLLEPVDHINDGPDAEDDPGTHVCAVRDSAGCTFVFSYKSGSRGDTDIPIVEAEKGKRCPQSRVSAVGVAGGAIALTLFLGLLGLIIWKVLTMFHDHREWVKFEKERVCANWERGENPLFKEPTTSFNNPTFDGVKD